MQLNRQPQPVVHPSPLFAFAETAAAMQATNHPPHQVFHQPEPTVVATAEPAATEPAAPSISLPSTTPVAGTIMISEHPSSAQPVTTPAAASIQQQESDGYVDVLSLKSVLELAGNDKGKALMAMAIGTTISDIDLTPIFDPDTEPFASSKTKSQWHPSQAVLRKEINRRAEYLKHVGECTPKCNGWNMKEQYKWLSKHPHMDKDKINWICRNWIRCKASHYKNLMIQSAREK
jgi:hypothetical protein